MPEKKAAGREGGMRQHFARVLTCSICLDDASLRNHIDGRPLPVPCFGDLERAEAVTIGINPSAQFFGENLNRPSVRLPMLHDFVLERRSLLSEEQLNRVANEQCGYFRRGSKHPFFGDFHFILNTANPDWTYESGAVAHIDLVACTRI